MKKPESIVSLLANLGYIIGCSCLFLLAISIIVTAIVSIVHELFSPRWVIYSLLDEVGLIVFSVAVIDVFKYLMTEEVLKNNKEKAPKEARHALTKFALIIATALSLEGLVLMIEVAKQDVTLMLYPVAMMLTATIFIVGIGIYQKLNASAEKGK